MDVAARFEGVLHSLGDRGCYQRRLLLFFICPLHFMIPYLLLNNVFLLSVPDHWCHVPGRYNMDLNDWKNLTIPKEEGQDGRLKFSLCKMYNSTGVKDENYNNLTVIDCIHGWEYDKSDYKRTAPSRMDWVCERGEYPTQILTIATAGNVAGILIFNPLADYIGRRLVFYILITQHVVAGVFRLFITNFTFFCILTFLAYSVFSPLLEITIYMVLEQSDAKFRSTVNAVAFIMWTLGMSLLPLLAWLTADYVFLGLLTTLPLALFWLSWKLLPESPRWLLSRGRSEEAEEVLRKISRINGTIPPANLSGQVRELSEIRKEHLGVRELFRGPVLRLRTFCLTVCSIGCTVVYYVLTFNTPNMSGNQFVNFFLLSIAELPSNLVGWWACEKFGRRWSQVFFMVMSGLVCLTASATIKDPSLVAATTALAVLAKFSITASFLILYLQGAEIFPTGIRMTGYGFTACLGSAFGSVAPYIAYLSEKNLALPYITIGSLSLVCSIIVSFLPETAGLPLPQTIQNAETLGKDQSYWTFGKCHATAEALKPVPQTPT